jgi:hypothetical protein
MDSVLVGGSLVVATCRQPRRDEQPMTNWTEGTVLTCIHDACQCRIRIESACHCADAGAAYVCTCGVPMIEVVEDMSLVTLHTAIDHRGS